MTAPMTLNGAMNGPALPQTSVIGMESRALRLLIQFYRYLMYQAVKSV